MVGTSSIMSNKMIMRNHLALVLLIFCFYNIACETDKCNFGTCGDCISFALEKCIWCAQDEFKDRRCRSSSHLNTSTTWCPEKFTINPQPKIVVTQNQDFGGMRDDLTVQFKPQRIAMKTRPGIPNKFEMSFRPAKDFPLDVYYLMDISDTMRKKVADLKNQALEIYSDLSVYTNNVRLGIGSFVEKPGFPYFDPNKHTGHAFKNHVQLTNNMTQFKSMIEHIQFGSNFDDPEAGLDGLMQAMKCEKEVGWRKGARRIIVLCTDSTYHSAGDGKIVGAIKPHDMQCHLKDNLYTEALTFDYPSVSQINKVAADEHFRIIFAIAENKDTGKVPKDEYQALAKEIVGARYAELESGKSVIKIIKEAYEELANSVPINFHAPPFVEITIDQDCDSEPKRNCESPHKQTVNITGILTIRSCPDTDSKVKHNVTVYPLGLADKLVIDLDIDCKCDCEKQEGVLTPAVCHGAGVLQCGVCKCEPGSYGVDCQCNGTSTDQTDMAKCKFKVDDVKLCSGRAQCRCGMCEKCQEGFSGDFCEFDDNSCPKPNNKLCSGKGKCTRGQCECDPHWTGEDCSCPDHNRNCFAPYSKEVCSGRGTCICGVCHCDALEGKNETYSGAFCDNCEECAEQRCKELEDYAYCNYMHMDDKAFCDKENNGTTTGIGISFVNKTEINGPKLYMAKWCKKELESNNGSYMVFKYQYESSSLKITIQKEIEAPPEADIWIAVVSAIGLVLLIGILTVIIWKILVDIHDKKEFKKFSDEALAAGYDVSQNPLYQDPSINFSNPVYNNQCN